MSQYSAEFIAKLLDKPRRNGNGWRACCPAHDDKEPSFDIEDGDKGPIFQCRSGCTQSAIIAALGDKGLWHDTSHTKKSTGGKAMPSSKGNQAKIVATYDYTDEQHVLLYQKVRLDPKSFRQRKPDGKGG
jgi:putative DNA primase/helicase